MPKPNQLAIYVFDQVILKRPRLVVVFLCLGMCFFLYHAKDFRLDASSETLVLEKDKDLEFSRVVDSRYGVGDFLVVAYTPDADLFSKESLQQLGRLQKEIEGVSDVESVVSILNVPLLESPPIPIKDLATRIQTLESPTVDIDLARTEFSESPIYRNLLVSPDLTTTALQVNLTVDRVYLDLLERRNGLRDKQAVGSLSAKETAELQHVSKQFLHHRDMMKARRHEQIEHIRDIMDDYRGDGELFLGGVSMIADDMISFIKSDLKVFGAGVLFFLVLMLGIIFKRIRWVLLPLLCCAFSAITMIGLLGWFDWEVTVISSNFISLQLIITMAIAIHLIVRYRELHAKFPDMGQRELILETVRLKFRPCVYAALTTVAGFGSLLFCNILPVITFGWMMATGIGVSLILTFLLFPALLMMFEKESPPQAGPSSFSLLSMFARITETRGGTILAISGILLVLSIIGISRLEVENAFINYFKKNTEIYQGMEVIDRKLGGTTPLDVVIDLETEEEEVPPSDTDTTVRANDIFAEFDEFETPADDKKYWFTSDKMARIMMIHDYLESLPETGKVLSLGTLLKMAERINEGRPLDNFQLALLYSELPEKYKDMLLAPYVSLSHDQVRFSVRVRDSEASLKRDRFLNDTRNDLVHSLNLKPDDVHLTGMLVLYNNMLQSLFNSQILTLGLTVLALMIMFFVLFKSLKIALIAIFPNLLSIGVVLGFMGWMHIPMDMMTITIAAISVGIAVDDTIHYIHRFTDEFHQDRSYIRSLHRCHESIGYAMYFTSITIIIGFSILVLSSFIPTIYFGLLTGLAMLIALLSALTLLPRLLILFKPFGPESTMSQA